MASLSVPRTAAALRASPAGPDPSDPHAAVIDHVAVRGHLSDVDAPVVDDGARGERPADPYAAVVLDLIRATVVACPEVSSMTVMSRSSSADQVAVFDPWPRWWTAGARRPV